MKANIKKEVALRIEDIELAVKYDLSRYKKRLEKELIKVLNRPKKIAKHFIVKELR